MASLKQLIVVVLFIVRLNAFTLQESRGNNGDVRYEAVVTDGSIGAISILLAFSAITPTSKMATLTKYPGQSSTTDIMYLDSSKNTRGCTEEINATYTAEPLSTTVSNTVPEVTPIPGYSTPSQLNPAATHYVQVGVHNQTLFRPNQLDAAIGDVVVFEFHRSNHTVSESTLNEPCKNSGGFDTGFNQAFSNSTRTPVVAFSVDNSAPRWFFCKQEKDESHCYDGMVFGLNPGERMNEFLNNARYQVETEACMLNVSSSCLRPQSNASMIESKTGLGRLPTGPLLSPLSSATSDGVGLRNRRRTAPLWGMIGVAGVGAV